MSADGLFSAHLREVDPEIAHVIGLELGRQRDEIELIASENIVSRAVLEAQGSVLTNKYAEGLPGKRYYGGCQYVDIAEKLAIERVTKLFGCKFANVQPHSGASANAEVFFALMQPGDTFMGLNLAAGGHLSHGMAVNMSGKWFKPVPYNVRRDDQRIDMDEVAKLATRAQAEGHHRRRLGLSAHHRLQALPRDRRRGRRLADGRHGALRRPRRRRRASVAVPARACRHHDHAQDAARPARRRHPHQRRGAGQEDQLGGVPRHAGRPADACDRRQGGGLRRGAAAIGFKTYARNVVENAKALAETLKSHGLDIVSGGTDTHLMLVDLRPKRLTGKVAEAALGRAHITCNKNGIPFDPEKPTVTSGIRLGTPAGTTRGFGVAEFRQVGEMIVEVLDVLSQKGVEEDSLVEGSGARQGEGACSTRFPIYQ